MPVILVGNKIDLRGGEVTNQGLEDEIAPIMREFKVCPNLTEQSPQLIRLRKSKRSSSVRRCYH